MLLQLHATSKSFPTSRELGQKGNLQSRPSSKTLMLHRHSSSSLPEFHLSLKNFQSSRTRTPTGHTSSECRGWGMAGVAVSEGCTQTPLLGGLRGRSDTSAPGVGGREAVDGSGRGEGGRGAVDGARNWFQAAARLQLQHQQPSGRHQIRTLPRHQSMTHRQWLGFKTQEG